MKEKGGGGRGEPLSLSHLLQEGRETDKKKKSETVFFPSPERGRRGRGDLEKRREGENPNFIFN